METKLTKQQVRDILGNKRFNMSGYDDYSGGNGSRGNCVINNMDVLNTFASHGIYEYTEYLYIDFYKGSPRIFYKYWNDALGEEIYDGLEGQTTSEIICLILDLTIYSGKQKRRVREHE